MGLTRAGKPALAVGLLNQALTQIARLGGGTNPADRAALEINTLVSLALAEFLLQGRDAALSRLDEAQALVDRAGPLVDGGALKARIAYQRANVHGRTGDLTHAAEAFEVVVRRLDAFTERERCSVQLSRGVLALSQSRPALAADAFAEAARLAREIGSPDEEFMALHNGGYAAYLLGDLPTALAEMAHAEQLDAQVSRATARLDRGTVLLEAGLVSEAVDVFRAGVAECTGRGEEQVWADYQLELARALLLLGRHEAALEAAQQGRAAYSRLGARAWEARAHLLELRVAVDRLGSGDHRISDPRGRAGEAARDADELVELAVALGDVDLAHRSRTVAAEAHALAGAMDTALARLERGRHRHDSLAEELHHAAVASSVFAASGDSARARRLVSRAARTLAAGQRGSASIDLRTARAVFGERLGRLDLDLAWGRGSGAVLESLERWRSATDRLPTVGRAPDEELAELTERLRGIRALMRDEAEGSERTALQRQASQLERRIRARDWTLSSGGDLTTDLTMRVRDARDVLGSLDRDLLWFFPRGDRLWGLGIHAGRATLKDLMPRDEAREVARRVRADLRVAATRNLGPLTNAVWGSLGVGARRLDGALVQPWPRRGRGLVLVTCEEVSALPWSLLPSVEGHPLTVAWSLTAFARRSSEGGLAPSLRPAPASGPHSVRAPGLHVSVGPDLPRGAAEAAAVVAAWPEVSARYVSPSSSRALVEALATPGIVHVAAHGTHVAESPLFSSVALHDGPMFAHELQPSGVAADHVVLSACDVGTTTQRPGDESLGLAASMLSLGARSVVAAVAPVPDDIAATTMARHHEGLAQGKASDEALAAAIAATDPIASAFLSLGGSWSR